MADRPRCFLCTHAFATHTWFEYSVHMDCLAAFALRDVEHNSAFLPAFKTIYEALGTHSHSGGILSADPEAALYALANMLPGLRQTTVLQGEEYLPALLLAVIAHNCEDSAALVQAVCEVGGDAGALLRPETKCGIGMHALQHFVRQCFKVYDTIKHPPASAGLSPQAIMHFITTYTLSHERESRRECEVCGLVLSEPAYGDHLCDKCQEIVCEVCKM